MLTAIDRDVHRVKQLGAGFAIESSPVRDELRVPAPERG
ncbi:MAG: hypothetical protein RLZZ135_2669 [Cyanobacteriota bacterium]